MVLRVISILFFVVMGILFFKGKALSLMINYSAVPRKKRDQIDKCAMGHCAGWLMFSLAFSLVFCLLSDILEAPTLDSIGWILFGLFIIIFLIYTNTGRRFDKR